MITPRRLFGFEAGGACSPKRKNEKAAAAIGDREALGKALTGMDRRRQTNPGHG